MSLKKKDVDKFSRSYQCFSKLLILYPMIHPATMHGLLVEFNYDYGFVMQLILKLESQRNALYWDEVARVSQIMEQENRARMNMYSDPNSINQHLTQLMANPMFNSYGESSGSNLQISSLMDVPGQHTDEATADENPETRVVELVDSAEFNNENLELNQIMQIPEFQLTGQRADVNTLYSRVDGLVENNSSPSINETMEVSNQQTAEAYSDPNMIAAHSAGITEGGTIYSYPGTSSNNWPISETGKISKARPLQTYTTPSIFETGAPGLVRNEDSQTMYLLPAHSNDWKIYEMMESAKLQMARIQSNSNPLTPGMMENQLRQAHYSQSAPNNTNWQIDTTEQALNLQTTQPHLYSNKPISRRMENQLNQTSASSSTSNMNWQSSGIREEAQNLQRNEVELQINATDWRTIQGLKKKVQTVFINPAPDNTLQSSKPQRTEPELSSNTYINIIGTKDKQKMKRNQTLHKTMQMNKMKQAKKPQPPKNPDIKNTGLMEKQINQNSAIDNTNWQIIELKDLSNIQTTPGTQYQSDSGTTYQISEIIEIPVIETTNPNLSSGSMMNTELIVNPISKPNPPHPQLQSISWKIGKTVEPKMQMTVSHSEPLVNSNNNQNTEDQISQTNPQFAKPVSKKRARKQKLKVMKSASEINIIETKVCKITETLIRKPVKRHLKINNSNLPNKKLRTEDQITKSTSDPEKSEVKEGHSGETNKLRSKTNDMKNKQELQPIQAEVELNTSQENQKRQTIKTRPSPKKTQPKKKENLKITTTEPGNIDSSQVNKIKKKPKDKIDKQRAKPKEFNEMKRNKESQIGKIKKNKERETNKSQSKGNKSQIGRPSKKNRFKMFESGTDFLKIDPHITKVEYTSEGQLITVCPNYNKKTNIGDPSTEVQFIRRFPNTTQTNKKYSKSKKNESQPTKEQERTAAKQKMKPQSKRQTAIPCTATSSSGSQNTTVTEKNQKAKSTKGRPKKNDPNPPKRKTGESSEVPKGSILCCCQSVGFRKKYKLPPFDTDDCVDLYPEILCPPEEAKAKNDEPTSVKRNYNTRSNKEKKMKEEV